MKHGINFLLSILCTCSIINLQAGYNPLRPVFTGALKGSLSRSLYPGIRNFGTSVPKLSNSNSWFKNTLNQYVQKHVTFEHINKASIWGMRILLASLAYNAFMLAKNITGINKSLSESILALEECNKTIDNTQPTMPSLQIMPIGITQSAEKPQSNDQPAWKTELDLKHKLRMTELDLKHKLRMTEQELKHKLSMTEQELRTLQRKESIRNLKKHEKLGDLDALTQAQDMLEHPESYDLAQTSALHSYLSEEGLWRHSNPQTRQRFAAASNQLEALTINKEIVDKDKSYFAPNKDYTTAKNRLLFLNVISITPQSLALGRRIENTHDVIVPSELVKWVAQDRKRAEEFILDLNQDIANLSLTIWEKKQQGDDVALGREIEVVLTAFKNEIEKELNKKIR